MPQSLFKFYGHLVFSTKYRKPWLDQSIRARVHAYLAVVMREMGCEYIKVGGTADHVHILFNLSKMHRPIDIIQKVKKESSKFIKTLGEKYSRFYWQNGYGIFSIDPREVETIKLYI